ncbi:MAG TPA: endolytic transglycosylase MltG [Elusimicrobia bacterium]|nr:endolytic transglycosylase MltG [Elusimicrobiota bacterium]HBT62798.1 endolytic transglycosylase MltG [Elusimicrobiota bacterium]
MNKTALAVLGAAALLAAAWLFWPGSAVEVTIPAGQSARETAALLRDKGVVRGTLMFRLLARATGIERRLKPGTYRLSRRMAPWRLVAALRAGGGGMKVVIPEGFSARQIAERLESSGVCKAGDFLRSAVANRLEGYLFPTTYYFEPGADPGRVADKMFQEFKKRVAAEYDRTDPKPRLTLHQLVTLSSIVEREAVLKQEQPMVAAVYLNRMRIRMRLEADPTVQYALGYWKKGLSIEDLHRDSPYNTYVHYGLPPGPICSPGLEAFRAALRPAQTGAIYFVADGQGGHVFSATHEEHLRAKQSFKRALREEKRRLQEQSR